MVMEADPKQLKPKAEQGWRSFLASADYLLAEAAEASSSGRSTSYHFKGLDTLCAEGYVHLAAHYLTLATEKAVKDHHVQRCWQTLQQGSVGLNEMEDQLLQGLEVLLGFSQQAWQALKLAGRKPVPLLHSLTQNFKSFAALAFLAAAPLDFSELLSQFYAQKLEDFYQAAKGKLIAQRTEEIQGSEEEEEEDNDDHEPDFMECENLESFCDDLMDEIPIAPLQRISEALRQLQIQDVSRAAYGEVVCNHVRQILEKKTRDNLTASVLASARGFLTAVILPFIWLVLGHNTSTGVAQELERWQQELTLHIYETVGKMRIEDLFDIVKLYPESMPAVRDLGECMKHCNLQRTLIGAYRQSCATRLQIPGAKTSDIIDMYVNSIKVLREVDPTGVLLEAVSGPTREYLQGRKDTIRCIVTAMTDDKSEVAGESLFDELQRPAMEEDDGDEEKEDDQFGLRQYETWRPEPVNMDIQNPAKAKRMHDIISMLVHIYGSKDLFINEYRGMLAERLLAKADFDTDNEIRTIELLKRRFGENNLHNCEVMMKDLADSKRLFNTIKVMPNSVQSPVRGKRSGPNRGIGPVSATILSVLFWPPLAEQPLSLPQEIADYLDEYAAKFWVAKQPRKLLWKHHLGTVELTLRVQGVARDFTVTPFQATILLHFQRKLSWAADNLAKEVGTSTNTLRRRAAFWVKHGVLSEAVSHVGQVSYRRAQTLDSSTHGACMPEAGPSSMEEDEGGSALVSKEDQLKQEMAMYEQYIMGMLINFEVGLPLDRIHNMLKMFVPDQAYDKSSEQLAAFMGQLVAEEKLAVSGNVYTKRN